MQLQIDFNKNVCIAIANGYRDIVVPAFQFQCFLLRRVHSHSYRFILNV